MRLVFVVILVNILSLCYAQKTINCIKEEYSDHSVIYGGAGKYEILIKGSISDDKIVEKWGDCYYSNALTVQIKRDSILIYNRVLRKGELSKYLFSSWNKEEFIMNSAKIMKFDNYPFCVHISFGIAVPDTDDGFSVLFKIFEDSEDRIRDEIVFMKNEAL